MIHPIALLYLLLRMVRAAQGLHASPDGYARGLSGELRRRRRRSRRVRRYAERVPSVLIEDEEELGAERPVPARVPAPRRPVDAAPQVGVASSAGCVPGASVAVPAAIVRGRCFMTGREAGARPVESRKLALTVLCALADQEQAQSRASTHVYAHLPDEGFALEQPPFLPAPRPSRQSAFVGSFRPTGEFGDSEFGERAVFAGREAA
ncbi:hypothetical protein GCM10007147_16060 [Nocardiopsis kunsanensis]|uniref:Uncharacterized protein n=1 Tax=Nocardiopsis kunsanensis TaxID=141693 RepID=A0A918XAH7_9ACTN|nr:hypothetical protein GCM10007147_16060 [Nocardiopsis kunsanensis]